MIFILASLSLIFDPYFLIDGKHPSTPNHWISHHYCASDFNTGFHKTASLTKTDLSALVYVFFCSDEHDEHHLNQHITIYDYDLLAQYPLRQSVLMLLLLSILMHSSVYLVYDILECVWIGISCNLSALLSSEPRFAINNVLLHKVIVKMLHPSVHSSIFWYIGIPWNCSTFRRRYL